ncbi:phage tail protein [Caldimonas brevitalea]|uniref:Phage tail protein n=1 Tax=Caldimonas brevitalea TaxID=413882 RepID=A0A0G3BNB4_9BURK|nr:phage tail protein [Caldimonas brevitalea]AKJ28841.1 phage tail protein [Caldimonas brevitalea]
MAVSLPNGATVSIASTYATLKNMTAITNAAQAVATLEASHGVAVSDILEVSSGWSKLNNRIVRASAVATNDVTFEGINTTSTSRYPAGSGTGSVRKITAWTQITQVLDSSTSGGEQQFTSYSFLEDDTERQIPTVKSAQSITFNVADDSTRPHYTVLVTADEDRIPRAIRVVLPTGAVLYYNAYVTFNKTPTLTKNEVMANQVTLSLVADPTRY